MAAISSVAAAPRVLYSIEEVYKQHAADVARWASRLGGPQVDVEDVVQDVFLTATQLLPEFRGDAKITTWLFRITQNKVRHRLRRLRFWRLLGVEKNEEAWLSAASTEASPLQRLERKDARRIVYQILDTMGDKYRTAFILFEIEKLSGEEIAQLLDQKVATIWVWLHRARTQFLDGLRKHEKSER